MISPLGFVAPEHQPRCVAEDRRERGAAAERYTTTDREDDARARDHDQHVDGDKERDQVRTRQHADILSERKLAASDLEHRTGHSPWMLTFPARHEIRDRRRSPDGAW